MIKKPKIVTDKKRIAEIFDRGIVLEILPSREALMERLASGDRLRIYIGADPTSDSLHLSHAKNYMFLEELRQLGHEVIILVGDFTAQIGDPSGRADTRPQFTEQQIKANVKSWLSQIRPLLGFGDKVNPPKVMYNSKWLARLSFKDVVSLAANFTVQQMMERDMFKKRLRDGVPIHLHEFLYPLMQGYDSVAMAVDIELCGTDQIFNALAGRTLVKRLQAREKFVVAVNLMENPKTGELMSKSRGTGVFLSSSPDDMFGAIMAQPDEMIAVLFTNCTRIPLAEMEAIMKAGPRDAKARVAVEIVKTFYGDAAARKAQERWTKTFSRKDFSGDLPLLRVDTSRSIPIVDLPLIAKIVKSKSDARRLVEQGGVSVNEVVVRDPKAGASLKHGDVVKIGKKNVFRVGA